MPFTATLPRIFTWQKAHCKCLLERDIMCWKCVSKCGVISRYFSALPCILRTREIGEHVAFWKSYNPSPLPSLTRPDGSCSLISFGGPQVLNPRKGWNGRWTVVSKVTKSGRRQVSIPLCGVEMRATRKENWVNTGDSVPWWGFYWFT